MKTLILFFLFIGSISAQNTLPNITLKDLFGNSINLSEIDNDGKPFIINFWSTWCSPCKRELNTINEVYEEWVEETGVKLYAVTIDDQRTVDRVKPYVNSSDWKFEILYDTNGDLKRALGVNSVPFTFLLDGNCNIVWKHNNYNQGDEEELHNQIKKLTNEKNNKTNRN